jgi:hypothetical protein
MNSLSEYFSKMGRKGSRKRWDGMSDVERKAAMTKVREGRAKAKRAKIMQSVRRGGK